MYDFQMYVTRSFDYVQRKDPIKTVVTIRVYAYGNGILFVDRDFATSLILIGECLIDVQLIGLGGDSHI